MILQTALNQQGLAEMGKVVPAKMAMNSITKLSADINEHCGETVTYSHHSQARRDGALPMLVEVNGRFYYRDEDVPAIVEALGLVPARARPQQKSTLESPAAA